MKHLIMYATTVSLLAFIYLTKSRRPVMDCCGGEYDNHPNLYE